MFDRKLSQERLLVGIGGNMGSGKSTVASELRRYGAKIIDADEMGWSVLAKGTAEYHQLVKTFGRGILTKTGNIDRRALGKLSFASKASLAKLNAIVHPALLDRVRKEIDRNRKGLVVVDAALLFVWGMDKEVDVAILVTAADRLKIKRQVDAGMKEEDVVARLKLQPPDAKIWRRADFVLENKGSFAELRRKCRALWNFFYSAKFQAFKVARER
ncbi:dephospho-CoA kinase [candidate division WOR-3 bacterium]|uniref:Dephospho-CoA kinase n=1 Tax=candidate division WOR-3 bacterium TaxID=2052148 RepID=A0A937XJ67_UNCW3|nr:dephospho-CoA kinase [candidate division WOR-3 bacterium]